MSQTVQPVKLLALKLLQIMLCFVHLYTKHSSLSATVQSVLQKLSRYFHEDRQQFKKTPLLYSPIHPCTMYWLSNHNLQ